MPIGQLEPIVLWGDPTTHMLCSVVVCTRNRATTLQPCLTALAAIVSAHRHEIVLVDNGSTDDTAELLREFARRDPRVRVVSEPVAGLARARNAGVRAASGVWLSFTDDDCYVRPSHVDDVLAVADRHQDLGYFGGRVVLHDPADAPVTIRLSTAREEYPPMTFLEPGAIHGANMVIRRSACSAHGMFNVRLGAGTPFVAEDIEMLARLSFAGESGAYEPSLEVAHHHRRQSAEEVEALSRAYDIGRGAYFASMLLGHADRRRTILRSLYWSLTRRQPFTMRALRARLGELRGAVGYWISGWFKRAES